MINYDGDGDDDDDDDDDGDDGRMSRGCGYVADSRSGSARCFSPGVSC